MLGLPLQLQDSEKSEKHEWPTESPNRNCHKPQKYQLGLFPYYQFKMINSSPLTPGRRLGFITIRIGCGKETKDKTPKTNPKTPAFGKVQT